MGCWAGSEREGYWAGSEREGYWAGSEREDYWAASVRRERLDYLDSMGCWVPLDHKDR